MATQPIVPPGPPSYAERTFSPPLLAFYQRHRSPEFAESQNVLYALVAHAVSRYQQARDAGGSWKSRAGILIDLVGLPLLAFAQVAGTYALFRWLLPGWSQWVVLVQMALNLAVAFVGCKATFSVARVFFVTDLDTGKVDRLALGRLDGLLDCRAPYRLVGGLLMTLAIQAAVLYHVPHQVGLPSELTLPQSFLVAGDNLLQGVFLDVFEIYNVHLADKVAHTAWSSTVFLFFRLVYEAHAGLLVFLLFRRGTVRGFLQHLPERLDPAGLVPWLDEICRRQAQWWGQCPNEVVFLMLVEEYLRGKHELVRELTHQFPGLGVADAVRRLFVVQKTDGSGQPQVIRLFEDAPAAG